MKQIKILFTILFICQIIFVQSKQSLQQKMTCVYYPAYNIVRCTQKNILSISYSVTKVSPENAYGIVLGYISCKENNDRIKKDYALVLDSTKHNMISVDIIHYASGLLHGPGVPVNTKL